ncbi:sulfatase-like hydrolase/transferase [Agreia sp.]|uniref:sulfatase-like hydrolase/transferase n=1 Tax=Agreia sp. TaxID=1872416 RepID=UPI0035BC430D
MKRAILVMFDSLNRHMLPPYGSDEIVAPNFARLAQRTLTLDNFYAGSMPCMPARRELHTGRYNFLHRSWGPLEPWDDSMPEMLKTAGVHTHLASDHQHYWEDGGATYHTRYSTWEFFRGQEGDPWKGRVGPLSDTQDALTGLYRQDVINRNHLQNEKDHPQHRTFDAGIDFVRSNADAAEPWFVQIETFDPHEPFFSYPQYADLYGSAAVTEPFDWPPYAKVTESSDRVAQARDAYKALVSMCDRSLGRVLDMMDELDLWSDTMLLVTTDHGYLLGEHGWWSKTIQPWFNELVHLPGFLWDPRSPRPGERSGDLTQTIDIAPTLLSFFDLDPASDMQGRPLSPAQASEHRDGVLFGGHGGHVNVTDGRYVYMRASASSSNEPLEDFTLMPTHMRSRFSVEELSDIELAAPFGFTKGVRPLKIPATSLINPHTFGSLLFDLESDPGQLNPLDDDGNELRMIDLLVRLMRESEAPASQFERLGVPMVGPASREHLAVRAQRGNAERAAERMPPLADFVAGRLNLGSSLPLLLADPRARQIVRERMPDVTRTELVEATEDVSLYDVAAMLATSIDVLRRLAAELAEIE